VSCSKNPYRGNPLVAGTNSGLEASRRRFVEVGFDHRLTKPVYLADRNELLAYLSQFALEERASISP